MIGIFNNTLKNKKQKIQVTRVQELSRQSILNIQTHRFLATYVGGSNSRGIFAGHARCLQASHRDCRMGSLINQALYVDAESAYLAPLTLILPETALLLSPSGYHRENKT